MDNINVIQFLFNVFEVIMNGARAVWNILSYNVPVAGLLRVVGNIVNFFGGNIDLSIFDGATISVMTIAGVSLGIIVIVVIIKKIIPFF